MKHHIGQKFVKNQFGQIKFGKSIKILMIVVELQNFGKNIDDLLKFAKFAKLFSHQTFVLYGML